MLNVSDGIETIGFGNERWALVNVTKLSFIDRLSI